MRGSETSGKAPTGRHRPFLGLLRIELRAVLPFALGVTLCAVLGLSLARLGFRFHAPIGSRARTGMVVGLVLACAVPVLATTFDPSGRPGLGRALKSLPIGGVFLARLVASCMALAVSAALIAAADAAVAWSGPVGRESAASLVFADRATLELFQGIGVFALLTTVFLAAYLQHALGATLLGLVSGGVPMALMLQESTNGLQWGVTYGLFAELGPGRLSVVALLAMCAISGLVSLRGRRARSLLWRTPRAVFVPVLILAIPAGSFAAKTLAAPPPAWGDERASVTGIHVQPDLSSFVVGLNHWRDRRSRVQSFWRVDTETYAVTEIPHPFQGARRILREVIDLVGWSNDGGELIAIRHMHGFNGENDYFRYSFGTGWIESPSYEDWFRFASPGGSKSRPARDGKGLYRRVISLVADVPDGQFADSSRWATAPGRPFETFGFGREGGVVSYDAKTGAMSVILEDVDPAMNAFALSPSGRWLQLSGREGDAQLHDLKTGRSGSIGPPGRLLSDHEYPVRRWLQATGTRVEKGLDGDRTFEADLAPGPFSNSSYGRLVPLGADRWIRRGRAGIDILDANYRVLRTLREETMEVIW